MGNTLNKVAKKAKGYRHLLIIMRHANAEPSSDTGDAGREISDKGRKQAKKVGKALAVMSLVPDRIVCSGATRARQTLDRMLKYFGDGPTVEMRQSLYEGGVDAVMDELRQAHGVRRLMIVGHEPTVSMAAQWLASPKSDPALLGLLGLGMSPASLVVFGSDKPCDQWTIRDADLIAVLTPKDCG